jgi:transcriptional regulator with XRE-family HTH domain
MRYANRPISAIKFRKFCYNNDLRAKDLAEILDQSVSTIYKYWNGKISVPDDKKKLLAEKTGLDIYEIFYNEEL